MFLLDAAEMLSAVAAWGTLVLAIVAGVVSWVTRSQTKKIKELTEVVTELKNSNIIMEKRFSLEKLVNLRQTIPVFYVDHVTPNDTFQRLEIYIKNAGTSFQYFNTDTHNASNNVKSFDNLNTEGNSNLPPVIQVYFKDWETRDEFEFNIRTMSTTGFEHTQRFIKKPGIRPTITPPEF